jgi:hypothetical protein
VPFRGDKTHSDTQQSAGGAAQLTAAGQPSAGNGRAASSPQEDAVKTDLGAPPPAGHEQARTNARPARRASWRSLRNWHVRSKLLLLVAVPVLAALALAGVSIATQVRNYQAYQRVEQLARLSGNVTTLVQQLRPALRCPRPS